MAKLNFDIFFLNFKEFQNTTWVPTGVFAYVWTYLSLQLYVSVSLWLVCLWKSGHLAFSNILMIINWKKITDWCVLVCQRLAYGQIQFWHIFLKFQRISKHNMGPHRSLCICLNLSVPTTLCECVTVTGVSLKKWPFGLFKYFNDN